MKRVSSYALLVLFCWVTIAVSHVARAQNAPSEAATLFQNVRVFDGKSAELSGPSNVLVRGNTIERISTSSIAVEGNVRIIDGVASTGLKG